MDATFKGSGGRDPIAQFRLVKVGATPTRGDLLYGGNLIVARIRERTLAGLDATGAPFTPYSAAYAKRKGAGLGHGRVDLFGADHHTHMLNALQAVVDSDESFSFGIYANAELETRARVHNEGLTVRTRLGSGKRKPKKGGKASYSMPERRWLDLSGADLTAAHDAIDERIEARLKLLQ